MIFDTPCMNMASLVNVGSRTVYVVSGLPRSGTSMLMRMAVAGGMNPVTDGIRQKDDANLHGYFEDVRTMAQTGFSDWIDEANGRLLKVVSTSIEALPPTHFYKVVFMRRQLDSILNSQSSMALDQRSKAWSDQDLETLRGIYQTQLRETLAWIKNRPNIQFLEIWYEDVLQNPVETARAVSDFWGVGDPAEMAVTVDAGLNRQGATLDRPVRGIVFDLDGVILDTLPSMEEAYYSACAQVLDQTPPPFSEYVKHLGKSFPEIMRILGLPNEPMHTVFKRESVARLHTTRVFPGVREMLEKFRLAGIPMAIATGKDTERATLFLKNYALDEYFTAIYGSDAVDHPKPAPDIVLLSLDALGIEAQDAIFVGDAISDLQAGHAANVPSVAALWGEPDRNALATVPHLVDLQSPSDFATFVLKTHE